MTDARQLEELVATLLHQAMDGSAPDFAGCDLTDAGLRSRVESAVAVGLALLPPLSGKRTIHSVGPYEIIRQLDPGGMGIVFLGRHRVLGRLAAVKVLPRPQCYLDDHRERFRREAVTLSRIAHLGIVRVHEVGESADGPWIAMEYVEGESLEGMLRELRAVDFAAAREMSRQALPGPGSYEDRVAAAIAQVADALAAVHSAGVVHRDIKPANLLTDRSGGIRLADFGLVRRADLTTLTHSGAVVGTRAYLSPELTEPTAEATPQSDLYALGVTLYELLTLEHPFRGETEEQLFRAIRERPPPLPRARNRHVGAALEAVCLRAIEKAPRRRYQNAAALAADLRSAVAGGVIAAPIRTSVRRARGSIVYHRRRVIAIASLFAAVTPLCFVGGEWLHRVWAEQQRRDFVTAVRIGTMLLMKDENGDTPLLKGRREEALRRFEACIELQPNSAEARLLAAEAALRLRQHDLARRLLSEQRSRFGEGFWLEDLERQLTGQPPHSVEELRSAAQKSRAENWSALECFALARALQNADLREAYEVAAKVARLAGDVVLPIDALIALILHLDATWDRPDRVFDPRLSFSMALHCYDSHLAAVPGDDLAMFNRALLIREASRSHVDLDGHSSTLLAAARRTLQELCLRQPTDEHRAHLLATIMAQAELKYANASDCIADAAALATALGPRARTVCGGDTYQSTVEALVLAEDYSAALDLMRQRLPPGPPGIGPLDVLVSLRAYWAKDLGLQVATDRLRAFVDGAAAQVEEHDATEARRTLAEAEGR